MFYSSIFVVKRRTGCPERSPRDDETLEKDAAPELEALTERVRHVVGPDAERHHHEGLAEDVADLEVAHHAALAAN